MSNTPEPSNLPTSTSGPSEHDGSGEGSASVLLSLRGISKNFGAVQAIQNRRQRCGQVSSHQDHFRNLGAVERTHLLEGRGNSCPHSAKCHGLRHRHRVPGLGALRQPRHRPEHVSRSRRDQVFDARRDQNGVGHQPVIEGSLGFDGEVRTPIGRVTFRRATPSHRRCPSGHARFAVGHSRRTNGGVGCIPDRAGAPVDSYFVITRDHSTGYFTQLERRIHCR